MSKTREARIQAYIKANDNAQWHIMRTRGYCEALVDGEDEVALAADREQRIRKHLEQWPADEFKTLRRETLNRQKYYNDMHDAGERILNQFKQMEKKNMTKGEARNKIYCLDFVDALEALGLIKFEEPKTPYQKLSQGMGDGTWTANGIMALIDDVGLKLVEK